INNLFPAQMVQRHLHHTHRTLYYLIPRCNHSRGLLSPQHRASNFWRIGQISNARFDDANARDVEPVPQVLLEGAVHLFVTRTQGYFSLVVKVVVRIHTRQPTHCSIALDANKVFVVVDFKRGFECVLDLPDKDHTDLNGIPHLVIHLYLFTVKVSRPKGYRTLAEKRVHPEEAIPFYCALVIPE